MAGKTIIFLLNKTLYELLDFRTELYYTNYINTHCRSHVVASSDLQPMVTVLAVVLLTTCFLDIGVMESNGVFKLGSIVSLKITNTDRYKDVCTCSSIIT